MASSGETILWFGVFLAVGIIFAWMFMNIKMIGEHNASTIEEDVKLFVDVFADICYVDEYEYNFTDVTENYQINILNYSLCLVKTEYEVCQKTACPTNLVINLSVKPYDILTFSKLNGITKVTIA